MKKQMKLLIPVEIECKDGALLGIPRDLNIFQCPSCRGIMERIECTKEQLEKYNCSRSFECCARAFKCNKCGRLMVGTAAAPDMD